MQEEWKLWGARSNVTMEWFFTPLWAIWSDVIMEWFFIPRRAVGFNIIQRRTIDLHCAIG